MKPPATDPCGACGSAGTVQCRRSFLGFWRCTCGKCGGGVLRPLTDGYRATYWIVGVLFGISLLMKLPLPPALVERARNAADFLSGPPERLTLSGLVARGLETEIAKLSRKHHGGDPFPKRAGELRRGSRPKTA